MSASMRLVYEGCGTGHITVGGADDDLRKSSQSARRWGPLGTNLEPTSWHHEPVCSELEDPR